MPFARGLLALATLLAAFTTSVIGAVDGRVAAIQLTQGTSGYDVGDVPIYTRDWVGELQSRLVRSGYEIDTQSGAFTKQTREAIAEFQSDNGLTVTGQPTPSLMRSLRSIEIRPGGSE